MKIAIVDEHDKVIGAAEKEDARKLGQIHRIVRILIFNKQGQLLLQKRSPKLEDSPNKWDFSVAGHVDEGEGYKQAAIREAKEELGLVSLALHPLASFYTEKEHAGNYIRRFNTVFMCTTNQELRPEPDEVSEVRWFSKAQLDGMVGECPQDFTSTFAAKYHELSELAIELL